MAVRFLPRPHTRFYPEFHLLTWLWQNAERTRWRMQCMRPYMKDVIVGTNMLKYVENSTAGTLLNRESPNIGKC